MIALAAFATATATVISSMASAVLKPEKAAVLQPDKPAVSSPHSVLLTCIPHGQVEQGHIAAADGSSAKQTTQEQQGQTLPGAHNAQQHSTTQCRRLKNSIRVGQSQCLAGSVSGLCCGSVVGLRRVLPCQPSLPTPTGSLERGLPVQQLQCSCGIIHDHH